MSLIQIIGTELELMHPKLYSCICRQVRITELYNILVRISWLLVIPQERYSQLFIFFVMGLCHPSDGSTSPKYKLLCFKSP
jgi:hypothetical protein